MGPTWDPSGADKTQVGHMLAPRTLLFVQILPAVNICQWHVPDAGLFVMTSTINCTNEASPDCSLKTMIAMKHLTSINILRNFSARTHFRRIGFSLFHVIWLNHIIRQRISGNGSELHFELLILGFALAWTILSISTGCNTRNWGCWPNGSRLPRKILVDCRYINCELRAQLKQKRAWQSGTHIMSYGIHVKSKANDNSLARLMHVR